MKVFSKIFFLIGFTVLSALTASASSDVKEMKSPEKMAWERVDSLDRQSVQNFLRKYPDGELAGAAKEAVEIQDRVAGLLEGKTREEAVIPFAVLGDAWKSWQEKNPSRGAIGYFARQSGDKVTLGWFSPRPLSGGKTSRNTVFSFDGRGLLIGPTSPGSILAFRTGGAKLELFKGMSFETPGSEPMYLMVMKDRGLVHIKGEGRITCPDGKTVEVK